VAWLRRFRFFLATCNTSHNASDPHEPVFTKCKESLEDGRRLENISWRLWHRELVQAQVKAQSSPSSSSVACPSYQPLTPVSMTPSHLDDSGRSSPTPSELPFHPNTTDVVMLSCPQLNTTGEQCGCFPWRVLTECLVRCCHDLSTCRAIPNLDANAGLQMLLPLWDSLPPPAIEIEFGPSRHPMPSFHSRTRQAHRWRKASSPTVSDASSSKCFHITWIYPNRASASHRQPQRGVINDQSRPRLRMHHKHHTSHLHRHQHHIIILHHLHRMSKHKHLPHLHLHHPHVHICNHRRISFHKQYFTPFSGPTMTKTIPSKLRWFLLSSTYPQRHPQILPLSPLSLHLSLSLAPIRATKAPPGQVPPRWRHTRSRVSSL